MVIKNAFDVKKHIKNERNGILDNGRLVVITFVKLIIQIIELY